MVYFFCKWFLRVFFAVFFRFDVSGVEHLPRTGPFILAANHRSYIDPLAALVFVPRRLGFLIKVTGYRYPVVRWVFDRLWFAALRRDKGSPGVKQVVSYLRRGRPVMVFPEGTRNLTRRRFLPGQPGIALVAQLTGVPVVPAYLGGTDRVLPPRARVFRPGRIRVAFGRPFHYAGEGRDAFTRRVMAEIAALAGCGS